MGNPTTLKNPLIGLSTYVILENTSRFSKTNNETSYIVTTLLFKNHIQNQLAALLTLTLFFSCSIFHSSYYTMTIYHIIP